MWNRLKIFLRLPFRKKILLLEASAAVQVSHLALRFVPFNMIGDWMGQVGIESAREVPEKEECRAREVGWAVALMSRNTPGETKCLHQAISTTWMLQRRGIDSTMYFGVKKPEEEGGILAHAWVRCGNSVVSGRAGHETFQVLTSFSRKGSKNS